MRENFWKQYTELVGESKCVIKSDDVRVFGDKIVRYCGSNQDLSGITVIFDAFDVTYSVHKLGDINYITYTKA